MVFFIIACSLTFIGLFFMIWPLLSFNSQKTELACAMRRNTDKDLLIIVIILLIACVLMITLYAHLGRSKEVKVWLQGKKQSEFVKTEMSKYGSRQQVIHALRAKLDKLPLNKDSAKGWYILGKLYFNEKNIQESILCFKRAVELKTNEPDYILDLVSLRFYLNHKLDADDKRLMEKLLKLSPNNINAINLLALSDYQDKNYEQAIRRWESLLTFFPSSSSDAKSLLEMIHQAQLRVNPLEIQATVNISKILKSKISPTDSLFVYVLESKGSRVPLAVRKLSPIQLPAHLSMSNANSMLPGQFLSLGRAVYCEARVSKSGNAMPTHGDLVGRSKTFLLKNKLEVISVLINKAID